MTRLVSIGLSIAMSMSFAATVQAAGKNDPVTDLRTVAFDTEVSTRIVGGERAEDNAWPWQVVLYIRDKGGHFAMACGGSLIQQGWVLTAAHCVNSLDPQDYAIVEGTGHIDQLLQKKGTGRKVLIRRVVRHEDYNAQTHENDIALLELDTPALAKPVRLAFGENGPLEAEGVPATVTGWGTLQAIGRDGRDVKTGEIVMPDDPKYFTQQLMQVEIPLVSEATCRKSYPGSKMDHRMICAGLPEGGKDSCQGDSGGPLVAQDADGQFKQIGVVSFGRQCAAQNAYGVYARVSAFQDWLQQSTKLTFVGDAQQPPRVPDASQQKPQQLPDQTQQTYVPDVPVKPSKSTVTNNAGLAVSFTQGETLKVGQSIQFKATTAKSGFLVLIDISPDGKMTQIYPNARSLTTPTGKRPNANFIERGHEVVVPDPKNPYEGFRFTADPPAGEGLLVAILSTDPLKSVALPNGPATMNRDEALDYLSKVTDELGRSIEVVGVGPATTAPTTNTPTTTTTTTPAPGKPRDWSFATRTYRIVQ
jgi:secreted trypsin-like serine protease